MWARFDLPCPTPLVRSTSRSITPSTPSTMHFHSFSRCCNGALRFWLFNYPTVCWIVRWRVSHYHRTDSKSYTLVEIPSNVPLHFWIWIVHQWSGLTGLRSMQIWAMLPLCIPVEQWKSQKEKNWFFSFNYCWISNGQSFHCKNSVGVLLEELKTFISPGGSRKK